MQANRTVKKTEQAKKTVDDAKSIQPKMAYLLDSPKSCSPTGKEGEKVRSSFDFSNLF